MIDTVYIKEKYCVFLKKIKFWSGSVLGYFSFLLSKNLDSSHKLQNGTQKERIIEKEELIKDEPAKPKKTNSYIELLLFFVLGILLGIAIKIEAVERITIGFDDYKMKIKKQDYNINKIQGEFILKQIEEAKNETSKENIGEKTNQAIK